MENTMWWSKNVCMHLQKHLMNEKLTNSTLKRCSLRGIYTSENYSCNLGGKDWGRQLLEGVLLCISFSSILGGVIILWGVIVMTYTYRYWHWENNLLSLDTKYHTPVQSPSSTSTSKKTFRRYFQLRPTVAGGLVSSSVIYQKCAHWEWTPAAPQLWLFWCSTWMWKTPPLKKHVF